ncbi:hypothetical protein G7046_g7095 [Stylonectria norvegica]|nr:hypothetical protein G7046_g7095 [Stylonectria norvegica]
MAQVPRPTSGSEAQIKPGDVPELEFLERKPRVSFAQLPTEIHYAISKRLIYPDALSLKHTNGYFYSLVNTGINLKVEWLIERRNLHLECPNDRRCDLQSDLRFCRGSASHATPPRTYGVRITTGAWMSSIWNKYMFASLQIHKTFATMDEGKMDGRTLVGVACFGTSFVHLGVDGRTVPMISAGKVDAAPAARAVVPSRPVRWISPEIFVPADR